MSDGNPNNHEIDAQQRAAQPDAAGAGWVGGPPMTEAELDQQLDRWLAELRGHVAPAGLASAIMARIEPPERFEQFLAWLTARLWRPVLIGALPVIAGFALGLGVPQQTDADLASQIGTLAFVDIYEELDDAEQP